MIKEVTDSDSFLGTLHCQQEMMLCVDTDKTQPYIEDCIAHKEPLVKVFIYPIYTFFIINYILVMFQLKVLLNESIMVDLQRISCRPVDNTLSFKVIDPGLR